MTEAQKWNRYADRIMAKHRGTPPNPPPEPAPAPGQGGGTPPNPAEE